MSIAYLHIRKAVALAPDDPDIQDTLAWWHYLSQDYLQAIHILKKVIKTQPEHPIYRYHLGMASLKNGESEQAKRHLRQALNLGIDAEHWNHIMEHLP
jgi:Flp pilus assembly protein TadD